MAVPLPSTLEQPLADPPGVRDISPAPLLPAPIRLLATAVDWAIIAIGGLMVMLVFVNVMFRFFGRDIAWTTELCELMMVWVTFLGGAAAARRGLHMAITEFIDKLGPVARRWTDGAITTLSLVLLLTLVWYGMAIVNASWGNELSVLQVPMAVQYLALPVGACAMAVFVGWDLVQILRGRTHAQRYGGM